jgi:hypothetical protein|tara:strand:+ start:1198 stop:1359 length:162 start_codon:yes stop_codon:yes gene_type:complete
MRIEVYISQDDEAAIRKALDASPDTPTYSSFAKYWIVKAAKAINNGQTTVELD